MHYEWLVATGLSRPSVRLTSWHQKDQTEFSKARIQRSNGTDAKIPLLRGPSRNQIELTLYHRDARITDLLEAAVLILFH